MAYEQKEGEISIFRNEKRQGNQPEYTGKALLNGEQLDIALWVKEANGKKFFAGKIQKKRSSN
jgi:hypothetical protein